ncbi:hypothetical protein ACOSQ4_032343 [Xanthoceras sorbifolium]
MASRKHRTFLRKILVPFKGVLVHQAFLNCCVDAGSVKKGKAVFEEMRELDLPITVDAFKKQFSSLAKNYVSAGYRDNAEKIKQRNLKRSFGSPRALLFHASLEFECVKSGRIVN